MCAIHRHERHHRHIGEKIPYLSHFTNDDEHDDEMTVLKPFVNSPSCRNPIGIGKSTSHDAHDGDDDGLQRFSKGVAALYLDMRDGAMGREYG
jgi:hypothetical protein